MKLIDDNNINGIMIILKRDSSKSISSIVAINTRIIGLKNPIER